MRGRFEVVVGQALQHIAHVDDDLSLLGQHVDPLTLHVEELEAARRGPDEQGDEVDVFVLLGPDRAVRLLRDRRVVNGAQDAVAVVYFIVEIMLAEVQMDGNGAQQMGAGTFKGLIELPAQLGEGGYFAGMHILRVFRGDGGTVDDLLADLEKLLKVGDLRLLGVLFAKRRISPLPCQPRYLILPLHGQGLFEKSFGVLVKPVDQGVGYAVVFHPHEADFVKSPAQGFDESPPLYFISMNILR